MSRFVPAGTDVDSLPPDDAWLKAKQQVEAQKKVKAAEGGQQEGGKSLYEVLQQNKAAKQEAFEESIRLKNQFRPLDEDEVDFLDSVLESNRAKEDAVKNETAEQLEAFRKQRALAEQALLNQQANDEVGKLDAPVGRAAWVTQKKKRRRDKESESGQDPKSRKLSSPTDDQGPASVQPNSLTSDRTNATDARPEDKKSPTQSQTDPPKVTPVGLDLGDYSSDDD
ncbi:hypothetical protein A1O3_09671 [Capronia epimyces CBS 606.96]|uniref:FAM192A/Fyv6 N-terminal domain-containing protein n=1 Tax=Capronia epimyces CBS 606.96 TaxID=1182542 RepID=W9XJD5_9EURO|nr:uncharacterized protein A1O3_09671 [Capronia epimyces CBS 606.96]EXJ77445.1 hypothetical protein A1O3_09671 [Capronia epimyces CBS 606.96]